MSFLSNMATNCHCSRETSAPHDSPANLLMAELFHTAPWWRRRPCSHDAGGLGWCGAAVACTDSLGLGPISADGRNCLLRCVDNGSMQLSCSLVLTSESSSLNVCQQSCITLSVRGARVWFIERLRALTLCGRSLLRDHLLYTLEGARSLGGSFIKLKSQLCTLLFLNFTGFSQLLFFSHP